MGCEPGATLTHGDSPLGLRAGIESVYSSPPGSERNKDAKMVTAGTLDLFSTIRKTCHSNTPKTLKFNSYVFLNSES